MSPTRVRPVNVLLAALAATVATVAPGFGADEPETTLSRLALDRGFRGNGATLARLGFDVVDQLAIDSAGRIVVAGAKRTLGEVETGIDVYAPLVARLLPNGRVDRTFGANGVTQPAALGRIGGLALGSRYRGEDEILVVGRFIDHSLHDLGAIRLFPDGAPDGSFGYGGTVRTDEITTGDWRFPAFDPTTGTVTVVVGDDPAGKTIRLTGDGAFDPSFGTGGLVSMDGFFLVAMAVDSEGRTVLSRLSRTDPRDPLSPQIREVVRLAADGSPDASYGGSGRLTGPGGGAVGASALDFDSGGRLVVRGQEEDGTLGFFRFLADGSLDASFSDDGFAPVRIGVPGDVQGSETAFGVAAVADGAFVSSGGAEFLSRTMSQSVAGGFMVQSVDPAKPSELRSIVVRDPRPYRRARTEIRSEAVAADGSTVVVGGYTILTSGGHERTQPVLARVDLVRSVAVPLPDVRIAQLSAAAESADGSFRLDVTIDLANDGPGAWRNGSVAMYLSDDDVLDPSDYLLGPWPTGPVRPGQTARVRFRTGWFAIGDIPTVTGKRLLAQLNPNGWVLEAGGANPVVAAPAFP